MSSGMEKNRMEGDCIAVAEVDCITKVEGDCSVEPELCVLLGSKGTFLGRRTMQMK